MSRFRIRFDEEHVYSRDWLTDNEEATQRILAKYKKLGINPRCECNASMPVMYIAHRNRYYLARNPGTGSNHASDCPSFELEKEDSGRFTYENDVIKSRADGTMSLKILAPLAHKVVDRASREESDVDALVPPRPKAKTNKREAMSLSGLLALLWEEAELNRWHPGFNKRRVWAVARKRIIDAAQKLYTKRTNIADVLYIPEHFNEMDKQEIDARRKATFKRIMKKTSTTTRFMIVVGGIRKINVQENSVAIMLGHQSHTVKYWGTQHIMKKLENSPVLKILNDDAEPRLVYTMMVVSSDDEGVMHIRDIGFLVTDMHMIPTYFEQDRLLTEKLIMNGRKFIKTMRYDGAMSVVHADYLLVDKPDEPLPMAIFRTFAPESIIEQRHDMKKRWQEKYGGFWIWDMEVQGDDVIPAIPKLALS